MPLGLQRRRETLTVELRCVPRRGIRADVRDDLHTVGGQDAKEIGELAVGMSYGEDARHGVRRLYAPPRLYPVDGLGKQPHLRSPPRIRRGLEGAHVGE